MRNGVLALGLMLAACAVGDSPGDGTTTAIEPSEITAPAAPPRTLSDGPEAAPAGSDRPVDLPERLANVVDDWRTDFSRRSIDLEELRVGIPATDPRDLIPPIDDPRFSDVAGAAWLAGVEPGVVFGTGPVTRFYPLSVLTRHEIVNDEVDGQPVVVTYCPLCNSAVVFDPVVDGTSLRFGVSGLLRNSDLVMWDDTTESLWQQITGEAIVGDLTGRRLVPLPSRIVSFEDFATAYPDGQVLSEDQGFGIPYGANPYVGYSSASAPIDAFITSSFGADRPPMSRVVGITGEAESVAIPFDLARERLVVETTVDGEPVVVLWGSGTADALDAAVIANSERIGTAAAYRPERPDGQPITLRAADGVIVDEETGSVWNVLGRAVSGPLDGTQLPVVPHRNEFWFAWSIYSPDGRLIDG